MTDIELVTVALALKKEFGRISPAYLKRKFGINQTHAAKICWLVENSLNQEFSSIKSVYNHVE